MFAGVFAKGPGAHARDYADEHWLLAALTPYDQADRCGSWTSETALVAQATTFNTAESRHETAPERCAETGRVIASWIRLDNRRALCAALGLEDRLSLTDPQIVLAAHRVWGGDCPDRLEGDFSFVIHDPQAQTFFCARDGAGAKPFFYYCDDAVFVFATTAALFAQMKRLPISPSEQWMARYLVGISQDHRDTAFDRVFKLPPGHRMTVGRDLPAVPQRYFEFFDNAPFATTRDERWVDDYRACFHRTVEDRLRSDFLIGAESSGGIDSSTIVAHAARHLGDARQDMHCFGLSHMAQEPEFVLATAMHCGLVKNHILTTPPYVRERAVLQRSIDVIGYPPENGLASLYHWFFEECSLHGVRTLLSGFGGDEIVTAQAGSLRRELLAGGAYAAAYREIPGNPVMRGLRLGRALARTRARRTAGAAAGGDLARRRLDSGVLREDARRDLDIEGRLRVIAREHAATEITSNQRVLERCASPFWNGLIAGRLEACQLMASSYGVDYRWPLLDRRLVAQYLATPVIEKRKGRLGRYLHRRACRGTVPDMILWKPDKSLGAITQRKHVANLPEDFDPDQLPDALHDLIDAQTLREQATWLRQAQCNPPPEQGPHLFAYTKSVGKVADLAAFLDTWR